jgi:hypothetical protein
MRLTFAARCLLALFIVMNSGAGGAQSFDLDKGREPVVSLDGNWRFHARVR